MKCPKCGDELSSATKVCPRCGYVVDDKVDEYLTSLEASLMDLKSVAPVSFGAYFSMNAYLLYGIMLIVLVVVTLMTGGGLFLILAALALVLMVVSLVRKFSGGRKSKASEDEFRRLQVETDTIMRVLKNDYGEAKEVRERLKSVTSELKDVVYEHNANRRHAVRVWIAVLAVTVAVSVAGIVLLGSRDMDKGQEAAPATAESVSLND